MAGEQEPAIASGSGMQRINPSAMATPGGHYSHAVVANGLVFISGQLPITPEGVKLVDAPFEAQAEQTLANVRAALEAADSTVDQLVQVRVYVDSMENWPAFNTVYAKWAGASKPARAVVPVGPLHFGLKVEVEAIGLVSRRPTPSPPSSGAETRSPAQPGS